MEDLEYQFYYDAEEPSITPAKPNLDSLKAASVGTKNIKLGWNKVDEAKGYIVYTSTNGKKWKKLTTTKKNTVLAYNNTKLIKKDANHFCPNENCPARNIEKLIHYASRDAMNFDGFGERIIEDFYNLGYIKDFSDFYNLSKYKDELITLEGFGEKSINNLLEAIENSKNNSLERLIYALGIRYVGKKTAKIFAYTFNC